jgi:cobalt-zinc-cadmium efflux system outer membrane protein
VQNVKQIKLQQNTQLQYSQKIQRQFDAGLIDRLDLTQNQLSTALLEQQLLNTQFSCLNSGLALDDVMQHPLFDDFSIPSEKK